MRIGVWGEPAIKLKVDKESDALYFRLDESAIVESEEVQPDVILDFDRNGQVVGVEMLGLSMRVDPGLIRDLQLETARTGPLQSAIAIAEN